MSSPDLEWHPGTHGSQGQPQQFYQEHEEGTIYEPAVEEWKYYEPTPYQTNWQGENDYDNGPNYPVPEEPDHQPPTTEEDPTAVWLGDPAEQEFRGSRERAIKVMDWKAAATAWLNIAKQADKAYHRGLVAPQIPDYDIYMINDYISNAHTILNEVDGFLLSDFYAYEGIMENMKGMTQYYEGHLGQSEDNWQSSEENDYDDNGEPVETNDYYNLDFDGTTSPVYDPDHPDYEPPAEEPPTEEQLWQEEEYLEDHEDEFVYPTQQEEEEFLASQERLDKIQHWTDVANKWKHGYATDARIAYKKFLQGQPDENHMSADTIPIYDLGEIERNERNAQYVIDFVNDFTKADFYWFSGDLDNLVAITDYYKEYLMNQK